MMRKIAVSALAAFAIIGTSAVSTAAPVSVDASQMSVYGYSGTGCSIGNASADVGNAIQMSFSKFDVHNNAGSATSRRKSCSIDIGVKGASTLNVSFTMSGQLFPGVSGRSTMRVSGAGSASGTISGMQGPFQETKVFRVTGLKPNSLNRMRVELDLVMDGKNVTENPSSLELRDFSIDTIG